MIFIFIFKVLKRNILQPRILYLARLLFRVEGDVEFPDKQRLKEFVTTTLALQKMLKDLL